MVSRDEQQSAWRPEGFNRYENICANRNYETASSLFLFLAHDAHSLLQAHVLVMHAVSSDV